ncbi:hypothetical protein F5B20DRAFT_489790 [Whalleya microplaca]|nr:hypothetical protein F5B20DRAFT_489790 [Whalleya microplaca]
MNAMAPKLHSHADGVVRFPVVCTAHMDLEILNDVLTDQRLVLVGKRDLSQLLSHDDKPIDPFETPFNQEYPEILQSMSEFMDATKNAKDISKTAFVVLDSTTAKDKVTCQVATDGRHEQESHWDYVTFRCQISSLIPALEALDQGNGTATARKLRNEAAMVGGVWKQQRVDGLKKKPPHFKLTDFPQSKDWDEYCGPESSESVLPYVPVFRTADISLETLATFLEQTYDQDWGDEEIADPRIAFVTSLSPPFHGGPATGPLEEKPPLPDALLGLTADDCDAITRSCFPSENPELNYNRFIIMGDYTEADKTVILASNNEFDGTLQLSRCDFKGALISLLAPDETGLTMDQMASEAVLEGPGIMSGP